MEQTRVSIRGRIVPLHRASHGRWYSAYQGGDYFEFRLAYGADRWLMSQSPENRLHDPAHVVGSGISIQDAANDFTATSLRSSEVPYPPTVTRGCDLAAASIDTLALALGEAMRLGYYDERHDLPQRAGHQVGDVLGLARWHSLQHLQLRQAYVAGREHYMVELNHGAAH